MIAPEQSNEDANFDISKKGLADVLGRRFALAKLAMVHDDDYEHEHYFVPDSNAQAELGTGQLVRLVTTGIDVGSSTSHLTISILYLRQASAGARCEVVLRELVHRSPVFLTPYSGDMHIDATALARIVSDAYETAGVKPKEIDSGSVILTGLAAQAANASAVANAAALDSGRFVTVAAGHHLEARLAAHGSGAVALSGSMHATVVHVDIGGGTTKLTLLRDGQILGSAALGIGGRLVRLDENGEVRGIAPTITPLLPHDAGPDRIAERLAGLLLEALDLSRHHPSKQLSALLLTEPLHSHDRVDAITFSGGVAEYVYRLEQRSFGDIGLLLGAALRGRIDQGLLPAPVERVAERIRATVFGASQFTVEVSANPLLRSHRRWLPLRDVPVLAVTIASAQPDAAQVRDAILAAHRSLDLTPGKQAVALHFPPWLAPSLAASGACSLITSMPDGPPVVVLQPGGSAIDIAAECGSSRVLPIEGVDLREFDVIDVGEMLEPSGRVAVVVKSLVFPAVHGAVHLPAPGI